MITRKLGALLRGKATPFQIVAACVLGALLGFAPAIAQAPGLYALLVGALLIVNANLGLALLVFGGTRILSWIAAPLSFEIGQFLLDGPTTDLARGIVNAPVLAWCGLSYYAVTGGQLLGLAIGLLLGFTIAGSVRSFRRRMAAASGNPSRLAEISSKPWARMLIWVFFGGKGKGTWDEKLSKRVGNPVRVWGVVLVAVVGGGLWFGQRVLVQTFARQNLELRLENVNGATAEVGAVELDLREGRFGLSALALADPKALERDLFSANELSADFDQVDILKRRVHMARLVVSEAKSGAPREVPGIRVGPKDDDEGAADEAPAEKGVWKLEDVLAEAETWKGRLEQGKRWLDRLSGMAGGGKDPEDEGFAERMARMAREAGWFSVEAGHLVDEAPTFRLSELVVDGLAANWLPEKVLDLRGSELSTQPWLLDQPAKLSLASRDGTVGFEVDLSPVSRAGGAGALRFHWKGLSVDQAMGMLRLDGSAPLKGGTLDLELDGAWADGKIGVLDLPLRVTFRGTTLSMPGVKETLLDELMVPVGLAGPLDALRVRFDASRFTDALVDAGKAELANQVRGRLEEELGGELGDRLQDIGDKAGIKLPGGLDEKVEGGAKDLLEGVLGGRKKKSGGG